MILFSQPVDAGLQKLCICSGLLWGTLFFVAMILSGQFPPPAPTQTGAELLAGIQDRLFLARASIPIGILAAGMGIPFNALIVGHVLRLESRRGGMPLLSAMALISGIANICFFFMVFFAWAGLFYRPDTDPGAARLVHDIIWLILVMAFSAPAMQMVVIAIAGLKDNSTAPLFPRWYCFLQLWLAVGTSTGSFAIYFFNGPFAWDGVISFWIPAAAFCVWLLSLCFIFWRFANTQVSQA